MFKYAVKDRRKAKEKRPTTYMGVPRSPLAGRSDPPSLLLLLKKAVSREWLGSCLGWLALGSSDDATETVGRLCVEVATSARPEADALSEFNIGECDISSDGGVEMVLARGSSMTRSSGYDY